VSITVLYIVLIGSTLLVVGVAGAAYWRYRKHMRASDHHLRDTLAEIDEERRIGQR